tara:strand:- start:1165 stop:1644 length:480 start_codon:yes stop_codon:yes gene_type:complete
MADTTSNSVNFDESVTYTGRVKWFNNKQGYGFVTVVIGDKQGEDIFVHHSGVRVGEEQYKYLVQGEYVDFSLKTSESSAHPYQATNVTGVNEGKLMCETRNELRLQRADGEGEDEVTERKPRRRGGNRRGGNRRGKQSKGSNTDEWGLENKSVSTQAEA